MENNLKRLRKQKGFSQLELSYETRISPPDISKMERNKVFPHPKWREKLAEALEVEEEKIFPKIDE
ncbi:helix-turn-helix domain-containing protein [Halanaerobium congolense]|jgi:putative transcriptional regulator|uniref:Putative transcriptional regulator n=1 Tax=Halanaerobium congolense TaxID=54121 RepID=A0A1G6T286_9FIRM|nr:helix-turn-helix transcriptional regulator [Halanaerobium congolense]SDD22597.1 putative transcriptional regulator [Halanaerobium congolense]SHN15396.1 putative transcriptional regulator [Halanaerobium congolense]